MGFDFDAGFRVEAGYFCEANCWDIACNFTHYYTHPHDAVTGTLFPTLNYFGSAQGGGATNVAIAEAEWHLHFNYFDIDLGKPLLFGCRFALHPHLGVRAAWIDQNGEVTYRGGAITSGSFLIDLKNNFWGAGLKTGIHSRYLLNPCWSLVSDLSTSLLWGLFDIEQRQNQGGVVQINLQEDIKRLIPTLQLAIGFAWERELCWYCPLRMVFSAMAEGQYWWRQNQIQRFVDSVFPIHIRNGEDLGLFGLTFKANVYF